MSDIKRVWANPESLWSEGRVKFVECVELVYASDYDAAQAELAALREELADTVDDLDTAVHHNIDLQFKNAEAMKLLHMSKELLSTISLHKTMAPADWCDSFKNEVADRLEKLRNALAQPTESGASE